MRKLKKFVKSPSLFLRDYFNKRHPIVRNEINCPQEEERILIAHDDALESLIAVNFPIDVVFTWVDNSDPQWQQRYQHHKGEAGTNVGRYATDAARFSNHDELYYSLKSVQKHLPWVRNIFIVTDNQVPAWFKPSAQVTLVDHRDIMDEACLPTFNSHVIEAHLHRIPGLAEHFIYFNDDVFVARNLAAGHFFKGNGIASLFVSSKSLQAMQQRGVATPTLSASLHCQSLLEAHHHQRIDTPLVHTYIPLRKSMFEESWRLYRKEIDAFISNKFRTDQDLNLATFLVPWLTYLYGQAVPARDICYYFNIRSPAATSHYRALRAGKRTGLLPHSFCANDFNTQKPPLANYHALLNSALQYHIENEN